MSSSNYSLPVLIDPTVLKDGQTRAFESYGVSQIPATFFIDSQKIIREIKIGNFDSTKEIKNIISSIR